MVNNFPLSDTGKEKNLMSKDTKQSPIYDAKPSNINSSLKHLSDLPSLNPFIN